jgi:hypothetical protein
MLAEKLMSNTCPIRFISAASAATNTVAMPTHQAGDVIIAYAVNASATTIPTLPSGWTNRGSAANTPLGIAYRFAYKVATSSSETTGVWTNATSIVVHVYRNVDTVNSMGVFLTNASITPSATTTLAFKALTADNIRNTSWFVAFSGSSGTTGLNISTAPTGMVTRTSSVGGSSACAGYDTNHILNSFSLTTVTLNQTVKPYTIITELQPTPTYP